MIDNRIAEKLEQISLTVSLKLALPMVLTVQNSDAPSKRFGLQGYILRTRIVNVLDFSLFSILNT